MHVDCNNATYDLINPSEAWFHKRLWAFQFGSVGATRLLVWAASLEDALEESADWLESDAPGHLIGHNSDDLRVLLEEAAEEMGYFGDLAEVNEDDWEAIEESATADLTYTEAGYLVSYEWWVDEVTTGTACYQRAMRESLLQEPDQVEHESGAKLDDQLDKMGFTETERGDILSKLVLGL